MRRLLGHLRALGMWAPVRVLYEVSRRLGLTGRLLRARWRHLEPPPLSSPTTAWPISGLERGWADRADQIVQGSLRILGRDVSLAETPNWHTDSHGHSWEQRAWWRIDLHADTQRDVKHVWEPARHAHLVTLARAASEFPETPTYKRALNSQLRSWLAQNPPEVGVHWYSSLELSVRALAWLEVLHLVGDRLDADVRAGMAGHLYHSGRHIVSELPYTLSSMRNNHLVGDAIGLVAIGKAFPTDRRARRWARLGDRLLQRHLSKHFAADGSSIEDSVGYRGFVLELLAARVALGDAPAEVSATVERAMVHLARLGVRSGPVPHIGDWDGGSVLQGPPDRPPPESSLRVAAAVLGSGHDLPAVTDGSDVGGGIGRVERGPWTVWLKAGAGESHGHADLLSVAVRHGSRWVVGDPGNGSYNRTRQERDYFRSSMAHSVLRLEGQDQRVPLSRFRWRYHPEADLGVPFDVGDFRVMWGCHDAYERLDPPRRMLRACLVSDRALVVADWIGGASADWQLSLPLHPDVDIPSFSTQTGAGMGLFLGDGTELDLFLPGAATAVRGSVDPYDGWWADDYDSVRPSTRLLVEGAGTGPVVWGIWIGTAPDMLVEGETLVVDGSSLWVEWAAGGPARLATREFA